MGRRMVIVDVNNEARELWDCVKTKKGICGPKAIGTCLRYSNYLRLTKLNKIDMNAVIPSKVA